jgi:hypothetical protein
MPLHMPKEEIWEIRGERVGEVRDESDFSNLRVTAD